MVDKKFSETPYPPVVLTIKLQLVKIYELELPAVDDREDQNISKMRKFSCNIGISFHLALMSLAAGLAANFQLGYLSSALAQPYKEIELYINNSLSERSGSPTSPGTIKVHFHAHRQVISAKN
jgi:hypothetical protein